jgi:hypothetical protein
MALVSLMEIADESLFKSRELPSAPYHNQGTNNDPQQCSTELGVERLLKNRLSIQVGNLCNMLRACFGGLLFQDSTAATTQCGEGNLSLVAGSETQSTKFLSAGLLVTISTPDSTLPCP